MVSPKKILKPDCAGAGHGQNIFRVGLHNHAGNAEVNERLGLSQFLFDFYLLGIRGRRHRIGHVDDAGNTAADGRGGTRGEVFLVGHAGLSEVNVPVNNSREDVFTFGVDFLFALGQLIVCADGDDFFIADRHAALKDFRRCYHPTIFDNEICCHCLFSFLWSSCFTISNLAHRSSLPKFANFLSLLEIGEDIIFARAECACERVSQRRGCCASSWLAKVSGAPDGP